MEQKKPVFSPTENLEQINEKARLRGLSYGQYVLAREFGLYKEDYYEDINLDHPKRFAFCQIKYHKKAR